MILTYGVNIPFFDDWAFVDMIDRYLSGNLTLHDIWAQHNEHRPVTIKLVTLLSASLTNWNLVTMMIFSAFVAFLTFCLIAFQISRTFRILEIKGYGLLIIFSSLMLSGLSQYENWTWAIAGHWFLVNFFAISAFVLLSSPSAGVSGFAMALVCAVLSLLSMAHGFLTLVLGLFILILQPVEHELTFLTKRVKPITWTIGMGFVTWLFFGNYVRPEHHPPFTKFLDEPVMFLKYIAAYPASSLLRDIELEALFFGAASVFVFAILSVLMMHKMSRNSKYYWSFIPWISIGLYALGTGLITAIGRLGFGWEHALTGRYTTMSALFYVAMAVIMWGLMKDFEFSGPRNTHRAIVGSMANVPVYLLIALSLFSSIRMFHKFPDFQAKRLIAMETLLNAGDQNNLLLVFPDAEFVIQKNEILKRQSLSLHKK